MTLLKIYNLEHSEDVGAVCTLPEGEHVIGRGAVLNCNDKRVSRNHAVICVGKDLVTIKAIHINPCFFKAASDNSVKILPKDTSVVLNDGDQFALLADVFWFRIKIIWPDTGESVKNNHLEMENNLGNKEENAMQTSGLTTIDNNAPSTSKRCSDEEELVNSKRTKVSYDNTNELSTVIPNKVVPPNDNITIIPALPSNLDLSISLKNASQINTSRKENLGTNINPSKLIDSLKYIVQEDYGSKNEENHKDKKRDEASTSNSKDVLGLVVGLTEASHSTEMEKKPENINVKQEKLSETQVENESDKGETSNSSLLMLNKIKKEELGEPRSENKDDSSDSNKNNACLLSPDKIKREESNQMEESTSHTVKADSKENPSCNPSCSADDKDKKKSRREKCWYGPNCYRKNPIHRQDFSHPGDDDYHSDPDDDRPQCPFGTTCYRKNLDHRRQFKHSNPPALKPSGDDGTPKRKRRFPKKKHRTDDSSQDQDAQNDHVDDGTDGTTKRKRQAAKKVQNYKFDDEEDDYDYNDPFIDDASSDAFELSSDDDDDNGEDSDWEDSQEVDEESQETRRLLKEAKRFTKADGKKKDS